MALLVITALCLPIRATACGDNEAQQTTANGYRLDGPSLVETRDYINAALAGSPEGGDLTYVFGFFSKDSTIGLSANVATLTSYPDQCTDIQKSPHC